MTGQRREPYCFRLTEPELLALQTEATRTGRTVSDLIRERLFTSSDDGWAVLRSLRALV